MLSKIHILHKTVFTSVSLHGREVYVEIVFIFYIDGTVSIMQDKLHTNIVQLIV